MSDTNETKPLVDESPVERDHGSYRTEAGYLPLKNEKDEIDAKIFYSGYFLKDATPGSRPITFVFNGGPGSPSLWLHLGTVSPFRVRMANDGFMPAPPYAVEDNPHGWFEHSDLVFIDPVGTGYSHAKDLETAKKHWSMRGDIDALGEFIRLFLNRSGRLGSPVFLAGESYGTTRSAGIAEYLTERGIGLSGLILVSFVLNFQTLRHYVGNDLPFPLFLPTFAATSWYHEKIDRKQWPVLREFLREVEEFAMGEYSIALMRGDALDEPSREIITKKLMGYLGVSESFVRNSKLRINIHRFIKELNREIESTVGRLDSRITGYDIDQVAADVEHDPSMSALMAPFTMAMGQHFRTHFGFETDREYMIFKGIKEPWVWDMPKEGPADTSECLRNAMVRNEHMRVLVCSGLYDLATPYLATEYTLNHLHLPEPLQMNIKIEEYEAGHMMYIHEPSLEKLGNDVRKFYKNEL